MPKDWDNAKGRIYTYYIDQRKPLKKVKQLMADIHSFNASIRSYRNHLDKWGYQKNGRKRAASRSTSGVLTNSHDNLLPTQIPGAPRIPNAEILHSGFPSPWHHDLWPGSNDNYSLWSPRVQTHNLVGGSDAALTTDGVSVTATQGAVDFDVRDHEGKTGLHRAVISGSLKEVDTLLSSGAAVEAQDAQGNQPLHYAAARGFTAIIKLLLRRGAEVDARGLEGRTGVHMAVLFPKALTVLLKKDPVLSIADDKGDTALHLALSKCTPNAIPNNVIKKLIRSGADVNQRNASGITPFHMVVDQAASTRTGHESYITLFLENNADINLTTGDGQYPFKLFLDRCSPSFSWALKKNVQNKEFKLFIQKRADPNTSLESGELCLHVALTKMYYYNVDQELINKLCEAVDINKQAADGDSHLHKLIRKISFYGYSTTYIETLLRRGADPNSMNHVGSTPLMLLLESNGRTRAHEIIPTMRILLDNGADEMHTNNAGDIPLYLVSRNFVGEDRETLIKMLLDSFIARSTDQVRQSGSTKRHDWWTKYHSLRATKLWFTYICRPELEIWPEDLAPFLSKRLLFLAAEDILQSVKSMLLELKETLGLDHEDTKAHRDHYVLILRDCQARDIEVDSQWYRFLLDLFD